MTVHAPLRAVRPAPVRARLFYPVARATALTLGVLVVVLSLAEDPGEVASGGGLTRALSRLLLGDPSHGDKVGHFLAYGGLSFATMIGFGRHRDSAALAVLALLALGAALEVLQAAGGVREGDPLDMLANTVGIAVGAGGGAACRVGARRRGIRLR